jgi:hypothetical protein
MSLVRPGTIDKTTGLQYQGQNEAGGAKRRLNWG